jgi:hypothetical protein
MKYTKYKRLQSLAAMAGPTPDTCGYNGKANILAPVSHRHSYILSAYDRVGEPFPGYVPKLQLIFTEIFRVSKLSKKFFSLLTAIFIITHYNYYNAYYGNRTIEECDLEKNMNSAAATSTVLVQKTKH